MRDARTGGGEKGEGRFANRPCGGLAARLNVTGDDEGHPYGKRVRRGMMLEGVGRFPNRPYGGSVWNPARE